MNGKFKVLSIGSKENNIFHSLEVIKDSIKNVKFPIICKNGSYISHKVNSLTINEDLEVMAEIEPVDPLIKYIFNNSINKLSFKLIGNSSLSGELTSSKFEITSVSVTY